MKEILFVCTGNTCRSPMAEGIAKQLLSKRIPFRLRISSAGTSAHEGQPASAHAVAVAGEHDVDLSAHRSRLLNATMVRRADLIVTMGEKHRDTVGVIDPGSLSCTFRLAEFSQGTGRDVADPFGGDEEAYRRTFDMIHECIEGMAERLAHPAGFGGWRGTDASGRSE